MNKIIKEEINRIREVMGLKLINESVIPAGVIKSLLTDFAQTVGKNLDDITQAATEGAKKASIVGLYNGLKNSTDQSIKNFVDSLDEVAGVYNKEVNDLLDEITSGKIADEIQEEIFTKMASKTAGVDTKLVDLLPDDVASYYKQTSNTYTRFKNNLEGFKNAYKNDPEALQKAIDKNVEIRNAIVNLPDGPFKDKLLKNWDEQIEFFDKNFVKGGDESVSLADDEIKEIIDNVSREFADESEEATEQILLYSNKSPIYKTVKKLYPGMKDANLMRITEEVGAKIIESSRLTGNNQALINAAEQVWGSARMTTARKEALIEEAIKKSNPKVGMTELQYWKNWWLGRDQSTGKALSFKERYIKYAQVNAMILGLNLLYNNKDNIMNMQLDDLPGDTAAEKLWNAMGGMESIIKAAVPFQLGFLGLMAADGLRTTVQPEFDQLYKTMGPGGYGWYKNIGDIEKVEDTNNPIKNSFKIILKQPKDGKSNLGSWTYDSDSNQLIQTAGGDFEIPNSGNTAAPAPAPTPQQDEMKEFESYVKQLWGADSKTTDTYYKRGNTFIADDGESEFEFVRDGNSFRQTK